MGKEEVVILVSVSSRYADIAEIFEELFLKYWSDCPYRLVFISESDMAKKYEGKDFFVKDNTWSLPYSIYEATKNYTADYYICLLGDALISDYINTDEVKKFVKELQMGNVCYCNLYCRREEDNPVSYELLLKKEYYGVAFVAFVASRSFIIKEFSSGCSDLEFELKFLEIATENRGNEERYLDMARICNNSFHILHGIQKGKWIRKTKNILADSCDKVKYSKRECVGIANALYSCLSDSIGRVMPSNSRILLKKIIGKFGMKFSTKY